MKIKSTDYTIKTHTLKNPPGENQRTQLVRKSTILMATVMVAICGCTTTPKGYVAREWSQALRELNIIPVFPPREDVYVGDIYISPTAPDKEAELESTKGWLPLGLWIGSVNLTNRISSFYANRSSFPKTPSETVEFMTNYTNAPFALVPQAADTNRNIFMNGDTHRLRMVGFPSFMSATFSQGDLSAVIPVEGLNIAMAASSSKSKSATLSVPVAESYGLPASEVFQAIRNPDGKFMVIGTNLKAADILSYAGKQVKDAKCDCPVDYAYVRLITEVFYTRALDVSINQKTTSGFGANVKPLASLGTVSQVVSTVSSNTASGSGATNSYITTRTESGTPADRATELNNQLSAAISQTAPGGSVKFVSAGEFGVGMRRTYERPVAIGYRGMLLKIYKDGRIEGMGALGADGGGWVPTMKNP